MRLAPRANVTEPLDWTYRVCHVLLELVGELALHGRHGLCGQREDRYGYKGQAEGALENRPGSRGKRWEGDEREQGQTFYERLILIY